MTWIPGVLSDVATAAPGQAPGSGTGAAAEPGTATFPDGAAFRIEIPSVEGPAVLTAVLRAAAVEGITVNRVSQGSGAMLLRRAELRDMAQAGHENGVEVCLFTGPRERFGTGAHARSDDGRAHGDQVRGLRQLRYALEDISRACEEGIRSFLIADLGLLRAVRTAQARGALPPGVVWKISASMSPTNPATVRLLEELGGSTINIPADVTLAELAEMRAAAGVPLDLYVESPDALGGVVRGQELGELVRAGAPLYAKFGLRNAAAVYPSGRHLERVATANAVEKVHRAAVALEWLDRLAPGLPQSKPGAAGLGVPVP